jgi:hypothetical protein
MIEEAKLILNAWQEELHKLEFKMVASQECGDAPTYYRQESERERLKKCIRDLEAMVYGTTNARLADDEQKPVEST